MDRIDDEQAGSTLEWVKGRSLVITRPERCIPRFSLSGTSALIIVAGMALEETQRPGVRSVQHHCDLRVF